MKQTTLYLLILALVVCAAFYPLFLGKFYATGDMRDVYIPLETFFHNETLAGRLPTWNPDISWGFPVIAAAQIGYFYPPLLLLRWLPVWFYLPLLLLVHLIAGAWGMWFFLRRLSLSKQAALLGSCSFILGHWVLQHLTHLNIVLATAWLPWQLLVAHSLSQKQKLASSDVAKLVLVLGTPFLAGQLQVPLMMAVVTSLYFVYLRRRFVQSSFFITLVAAGVFLLTSAQLLPTLELAQYSSRGASGDFDIARANQHSFPLYHTPTFVFPEFFGHDNTYWGKRLEIEYGVFIGTIPLLLAAWAIRQAWHQQRFWIVLGGIALLLALGSLSPFRLVGLEPSLWVFSAPARWLLFVAFSLSVLAAFGFDRLLEHKKSFQIFSSYCAAILITIVVAANLLFFIFPRVLPAALNQAVELLPNHYVSKPTEYYQAKVNDLVESIQTSTVSLSRIATLIPVALLILLPWLLKSKHWREILLTLSVVELIILGSTVSPTVPWQQILTPPETVKMLPANVQQGLARISSIQEEGDTGALLTNPSTRADATRREQQRNLLVPLIHAQFGIPGTSWPASLDLQSQEQKLREIKQNCGLACAPDWRPQLTSLNIAAVLAPDENNGVRIYELPAAPRAEFISTSADTIPVQYESFSPQKTRFIFEAKQAGNLIVRDTWFPGWQAKLDDSPIPISQFNDIFRQVQVPAGTHTVTMEYMSRPISIGIVLSLLTALTCGARLATKRHLL